MERNEHFWQFVANIEFCLDEAHTIQDPFDRFKYLENDIIIPSYTIFGNLTHEEKSSLFSLSRILLWEMLETQMAIRDTLFSSDEIEKKRESFFEQLTGIIIPKT